MKERGILFNGELVRAILDGRKTQTRRVIKDVPDGVTDVTRNNAGDAWFWWQDVHLGPPIPLKYGKAGDRLWVRETFYAFGQFQETGQRTKKGTPELTFIEHDPPTLHHGIRYVYVADAPSHPLTEPVYRTSLGWHLRPSIFMPRWASRITLEITDIRVERLQGINEKDALAEGFAYEMARIRNIESRWKLGDVNSESDDSLRAKGPEWFEVKWDEINGKKHPWASNPWCWCISFEVMK